MQKLKTNKLFYGKWPYKISTRVQGGNLLKVRGVESTKKWCSLDGFTLGWAHFKRNIDKPRLLKYISVLEPYLEQGIKIRAEYDTVNIFLDDCSLYKKLLSELNEFIVSITEPANQAEMETLLENNKYVLCDSLPKGIYKYKVHLRYMPATVRESLLIWAEKYSEDKLYVPEYTKNSLLMKSWWKDCYIYVADSSMLMLVAMAAQGHVRRTEEYKVRSSINTSL